MNNLFRLSSAIVLLISLTLTNATIASTTYQFEQASDGAVLGFLTFDDPSISTSSVWTTTDVLDVVSFQFDSGSGLQTISLLNPSILFAIESNDGSEIDAGTLHTNFGSTPNWILTFAINPGVDSTSLVQSCGTCQWNGHWVASPVPIPGAVWLFGSGILGLVGIARRKKAA